MKVFFTIEVRDAFTNELYGEIAARNSDHEFVIVRTGMASDTYSVEFETMGEAKAVAKTFERNQCCDHFVFNIVTHDGHADEAYACAMEANGPQRF